MPHSRDRGATQPPAEWKASRLGDEFTLQRGFDITVAEQRPGNVPVVSSSGITSFHDKAMVRGPGVVIGRKGQLGNAYYVEEPFWPHDTSLWVKDFHGNDPRFGALFLRWLRLERFDAATSVPTLNRNFVHPLEIAVPPAAEQRRIAEILDTLDETIRKTEQLIAKLKQVKQGLLHDLLTRGLDENGELRDPEQHPEQFKKSPLGRIPKEWGVVSFGALCESSAFGPRFPSDRYSVDGPLATLRTTDMDDEGNIELGTMPRASISPSSFSQHLLRPNDLLISRSGTCGIAAVFPRHSLDVVPGAFLIRFRLRQSGLSQMYRRYFNSSIGRPRLERLAVGGVQKNIKGSEVLALLVPQLPEVEAVRIVEVIDAKEAEANAEHIVLRKLRLLKQGLMEDLLTGRVRVTPLLSESAP